MTVAPILPIDISAAQAGLEARLAAMPAAPAAVNGHQSFAQMLIDGVQAADTKMVEANRMINRFAVDDSIPLHQVTFALEQARLSLEMMIQVRNRVLESYQQLMNMQL